MYTYIMIRTQLYLPDDMHRRLKQLAEARGTSLSELVREALDRIYAPAADEAVWREHIRGGAGLWRERDDLPDDFDRQIRRGRRLAGLLAADEKS